MARLLIALLVGETIASVDFFIGLFVGEYSEISKYWEWQYPQFAMNCMALTLAVFAPFRFESAKKKEISVLFLSAAGAFWVTHAGLFWLLDDLFELSPFQFGEFIRKLTDFERISSIYFLRGLAIYSISSAAFVIILLKIYQTTSSKPPAQRDQEIIVRFKTSVNEPARLLMGLAAAGRLPMIEKLRQEHEHPCLAQPFSMDVNRLDLINLADKREEKVKLNRYWYFGLSLLALISAAAEVPAAALILILFSGIVAFRQINLDRAVIVPAYQPKEFDPPSPPDGDDSSLNLVTYAGYDPFSQFGFRFGSWVLVVDTRRAKQDGLTEQTTINPVIEEIERVIINTITQAGQVVGTPSSPLTKSELGSVGSGRWFTGLIHCRRGLWEIGDGDGAAG